MPHAVFRAMHRPLQPLLMFQRKKRYGPVECTVTVEDEISGDDEPTKESKDAAGESLEEAKSPSDDPRGITFQFVLVKVSQEWDLVQAFSDRRQAAWPAVCQLLRVPEDGRQRKHQKENDPGQYCHQNDQD